jgi:pimeloyl-ACP methyl ester carboxylesterase
VTLALLLAASVYAGPLDLPAGKFSVIASTEAAPKGASAAYLLRFPSPLKSPFPQNDTVWGHLILPKGDGPFACVLVLPVMAAPNVWIETRFINRFTEAGLAVFWLEMPYQFHRRPHPSMPSGQVFLARTAPKLARNFRQSALDARRALEVLSKRPEIDSDRLAVFGVSLGALVGSAIYSVDARLRYAAFMLGGADFPTLVFASSMTGAFVKKLQVGPEQLRAAWEGLDPLQYKERNKGKKALLVNARWDAVIPAANARRLAEAFPDARHVWVPFGHYSALIHLLWVPRWIAGNIAENIGSSLKNGLDKSSIKKGRSS